MLPVLSKKKFKGQGLERVEGWEAPFVGETPAVKNSNLLRRDFTEPPTTFGMKR